MSLFTKGHREKEILDATKGPTLKKMIVFVIPIILSGVLQQTFSTADSIVVGRWASAEALGGVSATTSLINLIICLFTGLSIGATVAISQSIGAGKADLTSRHAHNAIATAIFGGVLVGIVGFVFARPILELMNTPEENIEYSVKYMRIYFCGAPFILLYNYGSAIMRAIGDTRRPLLFLCAGGVINVLLNVFLVCFAGLDSDGVAIATVVSNIISSALVLYSLCHSSHVCRIDPKRVRIYGNEFKRIIYLGLPAGIQSALFSGSNVLMQSSINSFGSAAVAGNGASLSIEIYCGFISEGFAHAAMTFIGQNTGAGKYDRVKTIFYQILATSAITVTVIAFIIILLRQNLIELFIADSPEAVAIGTRRLFVMMAVYFTGTAMTVISNCFRAMGKSILPMVVTVFGVCVFRIVWIYTVFANYRSLEILYTIYPLSWIVTGVTLAIMFAVEYKRLSKSHADQLKM